MEEKWGPARVQYGDWSGTAAMDESFNETGEFTPSDDWIIVGLEFYGGTEGQLEGDRRPRLVGDDASAHPETWLYVLCVKGDQWETIRDRGPAPDQRVEVTRFLVHAVEAIDILRNMKRWSIRVTRRGLDADWVVTDEGDVGLADE